MKTTLYFIILAIGIFLTGCGPALGPLFSGNAYLNGWMAVFSSVNALNEGTGPDAVELNGKLYAFNQNGLYTSTDAFTWTAEAPLQTPWLIRCDYSLCVYNGKLWISGGYGTDGITGMLNDVWSSDGGITWECKTAAAGWQARCRHRMVVFNGKLWILGGDDNDYYSVNYFNDVWSSPDGITWTEENAAAPWSSRSGHGVIVFRDKLWVMGGNTATGCVNDIWFSADGTVWTESPYPVPWQVRQEHTLLKYNNELYLLLGYSGNYPNDWIDIAKSADGLTWETVVSSYEPFQSISYNIFVFDGKIHITNWNVNWYFPYEYYTGNGRQE